MRYLLTHRGKSPACAINITHNPAEHNTAQMGLTILK
jgi:hypothetical protein